MRSIERFTTEYRIVFRQVAQLRSGCKNGGKELFIGWIQFFFDVLFRFPSEQVIRLFILQV